MATSIRYPANGAWPVQMRADMAAAYCDEPSVEAFRRKVKGGEYPDPREKGGRCMKWLKADLDRALAVPGATQQDDAPEDITALV